jgi:hypothetical protein
MFGRPVAFASEQPFHRYPGGCAEFWNEAMRQRGSGFVLFVCALIYTQDRLHRLLSIKCSFARLLNPSNEGEPFFRL